MTKVPELPSLGASELILCEMCRVADYLPESFLQLDFSDYVKQTQSRGQQLGRIVARPYKDHYEVLIGAEHFIAFQRNFPGKSLWIEVRFMSDKESVQQVFQNAAFSNPIEEAKFYRQIMSTFLWNSRQMADAVGLKRPTIANRLRLLNLNSSVIEMLAKGVLDSVAGKYLCSLKCKKQQLSLAKKAIIHGWSTAKLYLEINPSFLSKKSTDATTEIKQVEKKIPKDIYVSAMEKKISEKLGYSVTIDSHKNNQYKGKLEVSFYDSTGLSVISDFIWKYARNEKLYYGKVALDIKDLEGLNSIYEELADDGERE